MILLAYSFLHEGITCLSLEQILNEIRDQIVAAEDDDIPALPACRFLSALGKIDHSTVFAALPPVGPEVIQGESAAEFSFKDTWHNGWVFKLFKMGN